jgi:hypothetical protein
MHPRNPARLPLGRTIVAIAIAYVFALQGLADAVAAASHAAGRIDPTTRLLCLTGPAPAQPQVPGSGEDPTPCCVVHCAGHAPAADGAPIVSVAIRMPIQAARAAAGDDSRLLATALQRAFSARAPPVNEA